MRIAVSIEHPAWAHQFRHIIEKNNKDGESLVIAVDKDGDLRLLDAFGIKYLKLANSTGRNIVEKGWLFLKLCFSYTKAVKCFNADILIGRASPMMAVAARLTGKPHIIFEDTEVSKFSLRICKWLSSRIITPEKFFLDLGKKQERLPIYKELFYLHDEEFAPNRESIERYGIDTTEPYITVRFISWNASHDFGIKGLSDREKVEFVEELSALGRVYISSEKELPAELEKYKINLPFEMIHQMLYYATVVISEGASMASEAAILGTHAFYLNEIASGTTEEQEEKYHLLRALHDPKTRYQIALNETRELMKDPDIWQKGKEQREKILTELPDPNDIFWERMRALCAEA
ncbi:MAG: DUF354 domain-containing protein [Mogibacterium sp.]|nr:DUF354 domain-containing protein [Mogibacterium sp.]